MEDAEDALRPEEAVTIGWRNLAPGGAGDYTLTMERGGQILPLTTTPVQGSETTLYASLSDIRWCGEETQDITVMSLMSGSSAEVVGPTGDSLLCHDGTTGVAYIYSWSTYATDHLGTVRAVVTENQDGTSSIQKFDYEPFGVELFNPANVGCGNTHKFTGHERDQETGNDYMHFRYFSASMGRFQKPDSISDGAAANPQGWNLYSYVKGNPVNFNDPTGHMGKGGRPPGMEKAPMGDPTIYDPFPGLLWEFNDLVEVTTTYTTTVTRTESNGAKTTSIVATWTETQLVRRSTGATVEGSRQVYGVTTSVADDNKDPRLESEEARTQVQNAVERILELSPSHEAALNMLDSPAETLVQAATSW